MKKIYFWSIIILFIIINFYMLIYSNLIQYSLRDPKIMLLYTIVETIIVVLTNVAMLVNFVKNGWVGDKKVRIIFTILTLILLFIGINMFMLNVSVFKYFNFSVYAYFMTLSSMLMILSIKNYKQV